MSKLDNHHIVPSSRGGRRTVELPDTFHNAWHICFQNLKPQEIEVFVKKMNALMYSRNEITWEDINRLINQIKGGEKK